MDLTALAAAKLLLQKKRSWGWLLLAAALSSAAGTLLLLVLKNYLLYCLVTHFFVNFGMVRIAFGKMEKREFLKVWFLTYLAVILTGGVTEWLGGGISMLPAAVTLAAAGILRGIKREHENFDTHLFPAELRSREKKMSILAYWDSGNQLRDIYTGKPVSILSHEKFREWAGGEPPVRYVPFSSLGEKEGMLPVIDVEELVIYNGKQETCIRQAAIGEADEGLLEDKQYDLILHASLHE